MTSKMTLHAEPGKHEVTLTRSFNAPRDRVFRAFIDPDIIPRWWGPDNYTTTVDALEARKGGVWRFVQNGAEGEFAFNGVFHEVDAPQRIVYTFEFEGMPGHVLLETITFVEQDGVTTITDSSVFQSVEARDGMIASGMEQGADEGWNRLEALL